MIFGDKIIRDSIKTFCDNMKHTYKDWRQAEHKFINKRTGIKIRTAGGISNIQISGQSDRMYTDSEKECIFISIQDTINLQLSDKDFNISKDK